MTYRPSTAAETAERFRTSYELRQERKRTGRPWHADRWTEESVACLRELLLAQVGYFPRARAAIFAATLDEYGSCDPRRLERALKWAVDTGQVERTEDGYRRVRIRRAA